MGNGHHHPHPHSHGHGHTHGHGHGHQAAAPEAVPAAFDLTVPDGELSPEQLSRRSLVRRAGLLG
ncbi:histidinol-phosphatase, partial [Streptomyces sp. ECR3]